MHACLQSSQSGLRQYAIRISSRLQSTLNFHGIVPKSIVHKRPRSYIHTCIRSSFQELLQILNPRFGGVTSRIHNGTLHE